MNIKHSKDVQDSMSLLNDYLSSMENVDSVGTASSVPILSQVFGATLAALGFAYFSYHLHCPNEAPHRLSNEYSHMSNLPNSRLIGAQRQGYFHDTGIRNFLVAHRLPVLWSRVECNNQFDSPSSAWFDLARNIGLNEAIVTSFPGVGGELAVMTLFIPAESTTSDMVTSGQELLFLLINHFHKYARPALLEQSGIDGSIRRRSLLSGREIEVLEWTARGKSTGEIAPILGLSRKSVEFHIQGCKRKLNVFNRTHAVAKAILLGLLKFEPECADGLRSKGGPGAKAVRACRGNTPASTGALLAPLNFESIRPRPLERRMSEIST